VDSECAIGIEDGQRGHCADTERNGPELEK